jgi:hypothetical protein
MRLSPVFPQADFGIAGPPLSFARSWARASEPNGPAAQEYATLWGAVRNDLELKVKNRDENP